MAQREIKIPFKDYRADIILDVPFEGNISVSTPAPPQAISITIINSIDRPSVRVYYKNAASLDVQETISTTRTIEVLQNSKLSIGRADAINFNITGIKVSKSDGTLVKDSSANLFDLEEKLLKADCGMEFTEYLIDKLKAKQLFLTIDKAEKLISEIISSNK